MGQWLTELSTTEHFLLSIAVLSTSIFLIQTVLSLIGIDDDSSSEAELSLTFGDMLTIKNGISFLVGFSWGGLIVYDWGVTNTLLITLCGFLFGSTLVFVNMALLVALAQLKHQGNIQLENAIDQQATVTLVIPPQRSGVGKVSISLQGRLKEYHAITDGDALSRHTQVTVRDLIGSQLLVEQIT